MCSKRLLNRLIKKSFRAYNTGCQLVFFILSDSKVIRFLLCQVFKHQIYLILKFLVVLPNLHGVYHLHQRRKILFLLRGFIMDVADERGIKQRLGL